MNNFEEIFDINEELNEIVRQDGLFDFPTAAFTTDNIIFNKYATKLVPSDYVKWYVTLNYIIGLPAKKESKNSYKILHSENGSSYGTFPKSMMRDKKVPKWHYKVYKYQDGFCIKRNERLEDMEA